MKVLDTNVLALFIDDDDPEAARERPAAAAAKREMAFVSITVLLEFEWATSMTPGDRTFLLS